MTILAALRVLPPLLMVPAEASAPRMNETGPDASPPLPSGSFEERMVDRLIPAPEPPLKISPSSTYQLRMEGIVSSTDRMKHAEHWGCGSTPTLNQTGELKAARWLTRRWASSQRNASASAWPAKYPSALPQPVIVPATRSTIWRTECSRWGVPSGPRKYFWATMLVAFCDQVLGNSRSRCSKAVVPSRQLVMTASRVLATIVDLLAAPCWPGPRTSVPEEAGAERCDGTGSAEPSGTTNGQNHELQRCD